MMPNKCEWWAESEQEDAHCIYGYSWIGGSKIIFTSFCRVKFIPLIQDVRPDPDNDLPFHCKACIKGIEGVKYYMWQKNVNT